MAICEDSTAEPKQKASQNRLINEVEIIDNRSKIKKTIANSYSRAPYFKEVWPLIENVLDFKTDKIGELAENSVIQVCRYLGLGTEFELGSKSYSQTVELRKEKRLIAICNINNAREYINPIGGLSLYDKRTFAKEGIVLSFLKTNPITYNQFNNPFIENLSIIDVMMFKSRYEVIRMLDLYALE